MSSLPRIPVAGAGTRIAAASFAPIRTEGISAGSRVHVGKDREGGATPGRECQCSNSEGLSYDDRSIDQRKRMMHRVHVIQIVAVTAFLGSVAIAQQPGPAASAAAKPPVKPAVAATASVYRPAATVQDLMSGIIDPASKVVFKAVSTEETPNGIVETAPKNDEEWAAVRKNALMMVEGANLLLMPGRHIAPPAAAHTHNEGELAPAEIEVRVAKDRAAWNRFAVGFRNAALLSLKAAEGRKTDDFGPAGEAVDNACESCHLRFWYPDQEELLKNAPKP
jgi:hypothetical protein